VALKSVAALLPLLALLLGCTLLVCDVCVCGGLVVVQDPPLLYTLLLLLLAVPVVGLLQNVAYHC